MSHPPPTPSHTITRRGDEALLTTADGDRRRERYVYFHPDAPGRGPSHTVDDAAIVAAQLQRCRDQGLTWPRPAPVMRQWGEVEPLQG